MQETGKSLHELTSGLATFPQKLVNIKVRERRPFTEMDAVQEEIAKAEAYFGDEGRVLVRYSGTELLARVMLGLILDCTDLPGHFRGPPQPLGKAGRSRWKGRRPHNRGVTMNPVDHPMGGGEGRSSGGRHPCSPWGQLAKGLKTRKNKRTDNMIVKRRKKKKGR